MFKNILVPIDLTHVEESGGLIEQAKHFADSSDGQLTLLNVVPDIPGYVAAELPAGLRENVLRNAKTELSRLANESGLPASTKISIETGSPATKILDTAKEGNADVIIIASHQPGIADYLLGSTASKVVRHAHCSVVVLR